MESMAECYKHSAIICKGRKFVAGATNIIYKTNPDGSGPFRACHAEVRAIRIAKNLLKTDDLKGYTIFVTRVNQDGVLKSSKPCKDCSKFIEENKLKAEWT